MATRDGRRRHNNAGENISTPYSLWSVEKNHLDPRYPDEVVFLRDFVASPDCFNCFKGGDAMLVKSYQNLKSAGRALVLCDGMVRVVASGPPPAGLPGY